MLALAVNLGGAGLIALIVWWFWLAHGGSRRAQGDAPVVIVVADGVYSPARIETPAGQPVTLRFVRRDPSPCAGQVVFPALGRSADLPLGAPRDLVLTPPSPGEYAFTCQMSMYRGTLVAR